MRTIKEQDSGRQKMRTDTAFKFWKYLVEWKWVSQSRIAREETIKRELTVASKNFTMEIMRHDCHCRTMLKFLKPSHEWVKLIRKITVKLFIDNSQGSYLRTVQNMTLNRDSKLGLITLQILSQISSRISTYIAKHESRCGSNFDARINSRLYRIDWGDKCVKFTM